MHYYRNMKTFNHALIKQKRSTNDWSLQDVVFRLHDLGLEVSPVSILNWETGDSTPNAEMLPALGRVFNVGIEQFYTTDNKRE